jgi:hypothetical protein
VGGDVVGLCLTFRAACLDWLFGARYTRLHVNAEAVLGAGSACFAESVAWFVRMSPPSQRNDPSADVAAGRFAFVETINLMSCKWTYCYFPSSA